MFIIKATYKITLSIFTYYYTKMKTWNNKVLIICSLKS